MIIIIIIIIIITIIILINIISIMIMIIVIITNRRSTGSPHCSIKFMFKQNKAKNAQLFLIRD